MPRNTAAMRFLFKSDPMRTVLTRLLMAVLLLNTAFGAAIHEMAHVAQAGRDMGDLSLVRHLDAEHETETAPHEAAGEAACAWCVTPAGQAALPAPLFILDVSAAVAVTVIGSPDLHASGGVIRWCLGAREPPLQAYRPRAT